MKHEVNDVASYVLKKTGTISPMRLQKLVYYCQLWSMAWDGKPVFGDPIEAWSCSPVIPNLFKQHTGQFEITRIGGNVERFTEIQFETMDSVVEHYNAIGVTDLGQLVRSESPWVEAREGLGHSERGCNVITLKSMRTFREQFADLPLVR